MWKTFRAFVLNWLGLNSAWYMTTDNICWKNKQVEGQKENGNLLHTERCAAVRNYNGTAGICSNEDLALLLYLLLTAFSVSCVWTSGPRQTGFSCYLWGYSPGTWCKWQPLYPVSTSYLLFLWNEVAEGDSGRLWVRQGGCSYFYVNQGTEEIRKQEKCRSNFLSFHLFLFLSASLQNLHLTPASGFIWLVRTRLP